MRSVLIVYPHWPPSNLAGVHRVRLIANALPDHGWHPIILTVDEQDHEENLDPLLTQLVRPEVEVIKVRARAPWTAFGKRIAGDLGLRSWTALKKKSADLLKTRNIDFIWYSLPSWYPCLAGPSLAKSFGTPFAIDYQDPWIYEPAPHLSWFHRERWVLRAARILEPFALRKCAFISAINEDYMEGPLERHPELRSKPNTNIQLGFDPNDHNQDLTGVDVPWSPSDRVLLYAGTYWPQGEPLFDLMLEAVSKLRSTNEWPDNVKLVFIGTHHPDIKSIAEKSSEFELDDIVLEFPDRIPYLHVLEYLKRAHGTLAFGSTARHYSPSKIFQLILNGKPIVACFHQASSIFDILGACQADQGLVPFCEDDHETTLEGLKNALKWAQSPTPSWSPDLSNLEPHSARNITGKLVDSMETVLTS